MVSSLLSPLSLHLPSVFNHKLSLNIPALCTHWPEYTQTGDDVVTMSPGDQWPVCLHWVILTVSQCDLVKFNTGQPGCSLSSQLHRGKPREFDELNSTYCLCLNLKLMIIIIMEIPSSRATWDWRIMKLINVQCMTWLSKTPPVWLNWRWQHFVFLEESEEVPNNCWPLRPESTAELTNPS